MKILNFSLAPRSQRSKDAGRPVAGRFPQRRAPLLAVLALIVAVSQDTPALANGVGAETLASKASGFFDGLRQSKKVEAEKSAYRMDPVEYYDLGVQDNLKATRHFLKIRSAMYRSRSHRQLKNAAIAGSATSGAFATLAAGFTVLPSILTAAGFGAAGLLLGLTGYKAFETIRHRSKKTKPSLILNGIMTGMMAGAGIMAALNPVGWGIILLGVLGALAMIPTVKYGGQSIVNYSRSKFLAKEAAAVGKDGRVPGIPRR